MSTPTASIQHQRYHCDFVRAFEVSVPRAFRAVAFVGVDLDVDYGAWVGHGLAREGYWSEYWLLVSWMM